LNEEVHEILVSRDFSAVTAREVEAYGGDELVMSNVEIVATTITARKRIRSPPGRRR
jgi:hypothetical protein